MLDFLHVCVQSSRVPLLSTTVGRKNTSDLNEFQKKNQGMFRVFSSNSFTNKPASEVIERTFASH